MENKKLDDITLKISIKVILTPSDIDDIVACALEGGINYWCDEAAVVEQKEDGTPDYYGEYASDQISRGGSLRLHDRDEDKNYTLTRVKFIAGIIKYLEEMKPGIVITVDGRNIIDTCQVDANDADCIIQYALFGELVYG